MPTIEVQCSHCQAANTIDAARANQSLECNACGKAFRLNPNPDKTLKRTIQAKLDESGDPKNVLPVACPFCKQKFAIKLSMSGSTVACPVCKARLRFDIETTGVKASTRDIAPKPVVSAADQRPPKKMVVEPTAKQKPKPKRKSVSKPEPAESTETQSTIESVGLPPRAAIAKVEQTPQPTLVKSDSRVASESKSQLPPPLKAKMGQADPGEDVPQAKMLEEDQGANKKSLPSDAAQTKLMAMLPPRYTVSEQDSESVAEEVKNDAPFGIELGIDTSLTRIERGGERIAVRSLTREEKQRRKTMRVAIVYTFGIAVLIAVFWFLLKQSGE